MAVIQQSIEKVFQANINLINYDFLNKSKPRQNIPHINQI